MWTDEKARRKGKKKKQWRQNINEALKYRQARDLPRSLRRDKLHIRLFGFSNKSFLKSFQI